MGAVWALDSAPGSDWGGLSWSSEFLLPSGSLCCCLGALGWALSDSMFREGGFFSSYKELENNWWKKSQEWPLAFPFSLHCKVYFTEMNFCCVPFLWNGKQSCVPAIFQPHLCCLCAPFSCWCCAALECSAAVCSRGKCLNPAGGGEVSFPGSTPPGRGFGCSRMRKQEGEPWPAQEQRLSPKEACGIRG